jgi:hypothetical protein
MAELSSVRDSASSGKKRIFAIVSRPSAAELKGKAIRRIVIFDNHPDSLRLLLESGVGLDSDDAAARWERRAPMICGSILIAIVLVAMLWLLYCNCAPKSKEHLCQLEKQTKMKIGFIGQCASSSVVEQRLNNSRKRFCARFHWLARRCRRYVITHFAFATNYAKLHRFAAKNFSAVEKVLINLTLRRTASAVRHK